MKFLIFVLFISLVENNALYPGESGVVDLTPDNFQNLVVRSDEVWIVEFYAPWCGHCKNLVPEYTKAAKALKGIIKVGAVNADEYKALSNEYKIKGFPSIKIFGSDKSKPEDFKSHRNAKTLIDVSLKAAKDKAYIALDGKKSEESGDSPDSDVVVLTDSNFDKNVVKSNDMWLVEFYAPWCGHCKSLEPHWKKAASQLKGKVKLGALDATIHSVKSNEYGIQGYPTIKLFNKGEVEEFDGGRTATDIVQWALERLAGSIPPPEVVQLLNSKTLDAVCRDHPICVIAVLPHILDCQSECRNSYIKMFTKLGNKFKQKMWGWSWTEAMAHPDLEEALDMGGFGYPAIAALNTKKMQFALFRGSFSMSGLKEFFRDISYGRGYTVPVKGAKLPKISASEPWDGKDGVMPAEDSFDDETIKEEL